PSNQVATRNAHLAVENHTESPIFQMNRCYLLNVLFVAVRPLKLLPGMLTSQLETIDQSDTNWGGKFLNAFVLAVGHESCPCLSSRVGEHPLPEPKHTSTQSKGSPRECRDRAESEIPAP
ncbi:hypothetical protein J6590_098286, partial [Homalodisca vitripennis]